MEDAIIGVGTALGVILTVGICIISERLRGLTVALQDHNKTLYAGLLGICHRIEALTDEVEVKKKDDIP